MTWPHPRQHLDEPRRGPATYNPPGLAPAAVYAPVSGLVTTCGWKSEPNDGRRRSHRRSSNRTHQRLDHRVRVPGPAGRLQGAAEVSTAAAVEGDRCPARA